MVGDQHGAVSERLLQHEPDDSVVRRARAEPEPLALLAGQRLHRRAETPWRRDEPLLGQREEQVGGVVPQEPRLGLRQVQIGLVFKYDVPD